MSDQGLNKSNKDAAVYKPIYGGLIAISMFLGIAVGIISTRTFNIIKSAVSANDNTYEVSGVSDTNTYDQEYINQILDIFKTKYIKDIDSTNSKEFTYGAIKGIISSLNDPYTNFLSPEEAKSYLDQRSGDFEGIGVTLNYQDGYSYVESVIKSQPAEKAGILAKDIIVEVDGEDMSGKYPSEVASKIRGKSGSEVKIKIFRDNKESLDFSIVRAKIDIDNVMWKDLGNGIIEISIIQFNDESIEAFDESWDKVVSEATTKVPNIKGVVVDLRNNPGGYVKGVQHVLEEFLGNDVVMMKEKSKNSPEVVYKDQREGKFEKVPVTVLVNEGSASASEIFASSISENGRGKIIGKPTVGKGVEQQLITLSDGSILLIVFQQWLTPNGIEITKEKPIQPDYVVDFSKTDFEKGKDTQLAKALEVLKQ